MLCGTTTARRGVCSAPREICERTAKGERVGCEQTGTGRRACRDGFKSSFYASYARLVSSSWRVRKVCMSVAGRATVE